MYVVTPLLTMEQAQFVVNVLNEIPLPGLETKQAALGVQVALKQADPYEIDDETGQPLAPPEERVVVHEDVEPPGHPPAVVE